MMQRVGGYAVRVVRMIGGTDEYATLWEPSTLTGPHGSICHDDDGS